jgi:hypothetical protein
MSFLFQFAMREAPSEIEGVNFLSPDAGEDPYELDFVIPANASLAVVAAFITPASLPDKMIWDGGNYSVNLAVIGATDISFTAALQRADLNGNILQQLGVTPSVQTAPNASPLEVTPIVFEFPEVAASQLNQSDRLLVQLLAANSDSVNMHDFSILGGASGVFTPIAEPQQAGNNYNPFRRNKFLGFYWRQGDGAPYFNQYGQNLNPGGYGGG